MPVNEDLYDALATVASVDAVFDTKAPDNYTLAGTILIFQSISDVPGVFIDTELGTRAQRWQVSVESPVLPGVDALLAARTAKAAVLTALHGLSGGAIKLCEFESAPGETYESDSAPPYYFIPIDFMIYV
jgi:hypothetical protein